MRDIDMSPAAIAKRLEILASLYRLARSLKQARIVGPVDPDQAPSGPEKAKMRGA